MREYQGIKNSWEDDGFFGKLRDGIFDKAAYAELTVCLMKFQSSSEASFARDFVSWIWFMPVYMERQKEYVNNVSDQEYNRSKENVEELIAGIFGYPV